VDPQDQFDQAALVAVGKPMRQDGETSIYGYTAQTHLVELETIYKGKAGQETVRISSMPQTCTGGESYPNGTRWTRINESSSSPPGRTASGSR
jgi:hypothetical protein